MGLPFWVKKSLDPIIGFAHRVRREGKLRAVQRSIVTIFPTGNGKLPKKVPKTVEDLG